MTSNATLPYTIDSVMSGSTTIGYRQVGSGPGIIFLHGGMQASQHYMQLAESLAGAFTVYVPDRRGRGLSGPHGDQYSIAKECEDVAALLDKTGAHFMFGHSSGGLIALQAALTLPSIHKVAVYEPALSLNGSIPVDWEARYEDEIARGKLASAMITVIHGLNISAEATRIPRWLLLPFIKLLLQRDKLALKPNDVPLKKLIPTQHFDQLVVKEMAKSLESFAGMQAEVLLLGGAKSPVFLLDALEALRKTLPRVEYYRIPGSRSFRAKRDRS